MAKPPLLFVTQRLPYPPNKGEKIRSYQFLMRLRERYGIYLAACIDDPADAAHLETVRALVADMHIEMLHPRGKYLGALPRYLAGAPLSFALFDRPALRAWIAGVLERHRPQTGFIYSGNAAPLLLDQPLCPPRVVLDLVDVDSAKWESYAEVARGPIRWVYATEGRRVAAAEAAAAARAQAVMLVSEPEAALFRARNPGLAVPVHAIPLGVDFTRFDPSAPSEPPFTPDRPTFVFTGAMDYKPNVDAVLWFAESVMPGLRAALGPVRFVIAGANPVPAVQQLASAPDIAVTGRVADMRPYIAHATACVAPLLIARGLQSKVLEALAMARPTLVSPGALEGISAVPDRELLLCTTAESWISACRQVVAAPEWAAAIGAAGRARVVADFSWPPLLDALDRLL